MIINEDKLKNVHSLLISLMSYLESWSGSAVKINSGGRSKADQIRIYKEKFGKDWEKNMPKKSAHVFDPPLKCEAVDFTVKDVNLCKVVNVLFSVAQKFGITGIGIDLFHNYIHVDRKNRGLSYIKQWAYDSNGKIFYLN